mmetsp:Transcript_36586/g.118191  ORF Transcript_36586/g.118191 Transcript_36586/m.118191 type:complete len:257 (-) Transcript_36586:238-1008(-)
MVAIELAWSRATLLMMIATIKLLGHGPSGFPSVQAGPAVEGFGHWRGSIASFLCILAAPLLLRWRPTRLPAIEARVAIERRHLIATSSLVVTAPILFRRRPTRLPAIPTCVAIERFRSDGLILAAAPHLLTAVLLLCWRPSIFPPIEALIAIQGHGVGPQLLPLPHRGLQLPALRPSPGPVPCRRQPKHCQDRGHHHKADEVISGAAPNHCRHKKHAAGPGRRVSKTSLGQQRQAPSTCRAIASTAAGAGFVEGCG